MIQEQLPRLRFERGFSFPQLCESWALTQLAYYNDAAIPQRVMDCFTRAYAMNTITRFPRVGNGRPGFLMTDHVGGPNERIEISIEGMTSLNQVLRLLDSVSLTTFTTLGGEVYGTFATYASEIWTALAAHAPFWSQINHNRKPIIFTGHSLGAAIARILSVYVAKNYPYKSVECRMFGSPKVGTGRFEREADDYNRAVRTYCSSDPIGFLPAFAPIRDLSTLALDAMEVSRNLGFLSNSPSDEYWSRDFYQTTYGAERGATNFQGMLWQLRSAMNEDNPWYNHDRNLYRLMLSEGNSRLYSLDKYRFLHLEYPDQNSWGVNFRPGRGLDPDMLQNLGTPPAAVATGYVAPVNPPTAPLVPNQSEFLPQGVQPSRGIFGGGHLRRRVVTN